MFKVTYINYKDSYEECFIFANDIFEACEIAENLQGVSQVLEVEKLVSKKC